jgi:methionyl-tRNA synthetase
VPWDKSQVAYVWVDALINYWSALGFAHPDEDLRPRLWPEVRHLLAKDILKFHCVIWPALLMAAGLDVPKQLFVHGYLLMDERKMSKSLGNVIDPLDLIDVYGVDALRYYLFRVATFGQDGNISVDGVHERYERELGNDLGNLVSRTTAMISRYRDGRVRKAPVSAELAADVDRMRVAVESRLDAFDITGALEAIWESVRTLNRHVEQSAPWELAKDDTRGDDLDRVLYELADGLRAVAVALAAFVPETSARILAALGQPGDLAWSGVASGRLAEVDGIEPAAPLFPRVDAPATAA